MARCPTQPLKTAFDWRDSCCVWRMRNGQLPEICVPCQLVDDDEHTERWFRNLAYAPHAADVRLSALLTAGEDLIASFEVLLGLRRDIPARGNGNGNGNDTDNGNDSESSS